MEKEDKFLNCLWQVFDTLDENRTGTAQKSQLKVLTYLLSNAAGMHDNQEKIETALREKFDEKNELNFDEFYDFILKEAMTGTENLEKVDRACWTICSKPNLNLNRPQILVDRDDTFCLWRVYNSLAEFRESKVRLDYEEALYLLEKLVLAAGTSWNPIEYDCVKELNILSFWQFLHCLENQSMASLDRKVIKGAISQVYQEMFLEIMKKGNLYKKGWATGFKDRWFVLSPYKLEYFMSKREKEKKGEIPLNKFWKVEPIADSSKHGTYQNRFVLINSDPEAERQAAIKSNQKLRYELSASGPIVKQQWMTAIENMIKASENKISVQRVSIKKRQNSRNQKRAEQEALKIKQQEEKELMKKREQELEEEKLARKEAEERAQREEELKEKERLARAEAEKRAENLEKLKKEEENARALAESRALETARLQEEAEERADRAIALREEAEKKAEKEKELKRKAELRAEEMTTLQAQEVKARIEAEAKAEQELLKKIVAEKMAAEEAAQKAEMEREAAEKATILQAEKQRGAELEMLNKQLEQYLEELEQAKYEEDKARAIQERLLEDERKKREELEKMKIEQEESLRNEQQKRGALEALSKKQEEILETERLKLVELERQRQEADQKLKEVEERMQAAEKAKEQVARHSRELQSTPIGLARPIQPRVRTPLTHRGEGAHTLEEFDHLKKKWELQKKNKCPENPQEPTSNNPTEDGNNADTFGAGDDGQLKEVNGTEPIGDNPNDSQIKGENEESSTLEPNNGLHVV